MKRLLPKFGAVAILAAISLPGLAGASRLDSHSEGGTTSGPETDQPGNAGRCTGSPFVLVKVSDLDAAEHARADKADRNGNGLVCRMDIPGHGHGNTKNNSNIKDDKV